MQEPADFPDRRGQLIRDFEHYLGILKAVHSGADLQASAKAAAHCLPSGAKGHLGYVLASLGSNQARPCPLPSHSLALIEQFEMARSQPTHAQRLRMEHSLPEPALQLRAGSCWGLSMGNCAPLSGPACRRIGGAQHG